jgi:hypothetical protein
MKLLYKIQFIGILLHCLAINAQTGTSSPYSVYGIGDINPLGTGTSRGMGGAGISLPSETSLNNLNPASYFTIDSLTFLTDLGLNFKSSTYSTTSQSQARNAVGLNFFAIGFRNTSWWKNSLGIAPFSSVGNNFNTQKNIEGSSGLINISEQGSGGLNQFYWGNAFKLTPNLSIGVNIAFIFGDIKQIENATLDGMTGTLVTEDNIYLRKLYLNYGVQYKFKLAKNINGSVGGVFGKSGKLNLFHQVTVTDNSNNILKDQEESQSTFTLPAFFGVGASLKFNEKLLLTSDYTFHNWANSTSLQSNIRLVNSHNYMFGAEYLPSTSFRDKGFKQIKYRIGGYVNSTYLMVNGQQLIDKGFSIGLGIPIVHKKLYFNMAYEIGNKGSNSNKGVINENYQNFILNITLNDFWFFKPKFD